MSDSPVNLTAGLPETVLPPLPPDVAQRMQEAVLAPREHRKAAVAAVVADNPKLLEGWAELGDLADDDVEAYAYYRVGYHRGLDALRAHGWRGSGYVRWRRPTNRGFLRALDGLRRSAAAIGEVEEDERCDQFLHQLEPEWGRLDMDQQP